MTAEDLMKRFAMAEHVENGSFVECHYPYDGRGRAASGSIYYYVGPEEITQFHRIDCDEYWCYVAGSTLELWQIDEAGQLQKDLLGTQDGTQPLIYLRKGVTFASRHLAGETEGTFLTCITVPRFSEQGFELFSREKMMKEYPFLSEFYGR